MSNYVELSADNTGGSGEGYCVDTTAVNFRNWLEKYGVYSTALITNLHSKYSRVALLNNINVEEDRGQGYGTDLLNSLIFAAESQNVDAIFLVADSAESQSEGFNLVTWYENNGFSIVCDTPCGPLMVSEYI